MKLQRLFLTLAIVLALVACGGNGGGTPAATPSLPTPTTPTTIAITGWIQDGPVTGGTIYVFTAAEISTALNAADSASDRALALADASPIATMTRAAADEDSYTIDVPAEHGGSAVYIVFDNAGATDGTFGDEPLNMESVVLLEDAGSTARANITPQTSMIATQVRALTDGDITTATANVVSATGSDEFGNELLPDGTDIIGHWVRENILSASVAVSRQVRVAAALTGLSRRAVLVALGTDAVDGTIDGQVPAALATDQDDITNAAEVAEIANAGKLDFEIVGGSCESAANLLAKACEFDIIDDFLEARAICQDTDDEEEYGECMADVSADAEETEEECAAVSEARLDLCQGVGDEPHIPEFGEDWIDSFVDPRDIGQSVEPNQWFPLIAGNTWVYEATSEDDEGEQVTEVITVVVTNDQVAEDGELVEDTDDLFAQDALGNVWYCGEVAENFETFEDDEPSTPELVDLEGSWKHGRDTAEAGMLLPQVPDVGDVIRQEVLYGEAEDAIEILSVTGTGAAPGASCEQSCLVTRDFTPLEPESEENKYYISGIGLILEVDIESGDRAELQTFTAGP